MRHLPGILSLILSLGFAACAAGLGLPDAADPVAGMGVNIHFNDPKPGELEMLSEAGFRWIRTDVVWAQSEKQPGVYDFSEQDRLFASLDKFHLRAFCILDYTNPLYDGGKPTCSDAGRQAFARWAVAAVTHFKGRGVLWEIWNEPNGEWFWKPKPNPNDYAKLAFTVTSAIHDAAPCEMVAGPALSCGLPWPDPVKMQFLDTVAASGVLQYWLAVTVHPYLWTSPETNGSIYDMSRAVIEKHLGPNQKVALICGETGHSSSTTNLINARYNGQVDEMTQGQYVARTFLFDVFKGIPITIWYDWHNDSPSPTDGESNFGTVRYAYRAGVDPVYQPKPAYDAAKTYFRQLVGSRFIRRQRTDSPDDYILLFSAPEGARIVAWTAAKNPHKVPIPLEDGRYRLTSFDGKEQSQLSATGGSISLTLDGGPRYLKKWSRE